MGGTRFIASLSLHAVFLGALVAVHWHQTEPPAPEREEQTFFFELTDESSVVSETGPALDEPTPVEPEIPEETPPDEPVSEAPSAIPQESPAAVESVPVTVEEPVEPETPAPPRTATPPPASAPASAPPAEREQAAIVSEPLALNRIVPTYPRNARRRGKEGTVTVEAAVDATGAVSGVTVIGSSGSAELDAAAVRAVKSAAFAPATENGVGIRGQVRLTFDFRLR